MLINILDKNFLFKIKNFKNVLILNDLKELNKVENYLKKNNILILGYYLQNIFFFKKDFNLKKIEKKNIVNDLKKRIIKFYINKVNFIINIKKIIIKFIYLLKKIKNGNY